MTAALGMFIMFDVELRFLNGISLVLACRLLIESSRLEAYPLTVVATIFSDELSLDVDVLLLSF